MADRLALRFEVEDLLLHEAALLDRHEYEAWLDLFTTDGSYRVPGGPVGREEWSVAIIDDDRALLTERVGRLVGGSAFAQEPRSRTVHHVAGFRVLSESDVGGEVEAECTFVVVTSRRDRQAVHAGRARYRLRRVDGRLAIEHKEVDLVDRDAHLGNLSVLL